MTSFEVKSVITLSKFRKYWLKKFFQKPTTILFYLLMATLSVVAKFELIPWFIAFFGLLGSMLLPLVILFKIQKSYKSNPNSLKEMIFQFNEEDLLVSCDGVQDKHTYDKIFKIEDDGPFILVYLNASSALYIDGSSFREQEGSADVIKKLSEKEGLDFSVKEE